MFFVFFVVYCGVMLTIFHVCFFVFFFFKQKTAYEMRISDWSSDVCSSDLAALPHSLHRLCRGRRRGGRDDQDLDPRRRPAARRMGGAVAADRRMGRLLYRRDG